MKRRRADDPVTAGQFFINRLERLVRLLKDYSPTSPEEARDPSMLNPLGVRLLERCITATYFDAEDQGAGAEARVLMASWLPGWAPE